MREDKPFRPLAALLIRRILVWALLATLAFAALQAWLTYRAVEQRFVDTFRSVGSYTAETLTPLVWRIHDDLAQSMLDALAKNPMVGYVEVRENSEGTGRVFAKSGDGSNTDRGIELSFSIMAPYPTEHAIGQLRLVMSKAALLAEVWKSVGVVVLQCAAMTALLVAAVLALLQRNLLRPMAQLGEFVTKLDANNLSAPLAIRRSSSATRDELDLVVDGFQTLQGRIASHVDTLSEQVADRTAHLQRALDSLKVLSTTDALTGCYNRLHFGERFPQELARALRYGRPLSTIFCDVDRFKSVNDTHGHAVGDQVLRAVGLRLRESLRSSGDWVVRYGGEEFVLVLPETSLVQASQLAERIRQAVAEQVRIPLADGSELCVTVSFGVAEQHPSDDGESLLKRADHWLFEAKRCGRNQVQPVL
ncbi:diguanylate cyclase [Pelomonas sp. V22]|uniref:sensor domain-containing diguanylate cyclase n=1 Tax=Pelomonas sp. V22 TaxID=2822139 RepID=UPI0024A94A1C|nr:sensor domain-containing diguanylate cyclase [Pelomonas sp. V22]MDI4634860.1 diguanylate cyclase [Pelomonas sp. V22]